MVLLGTFVRGLKTGLIFAWSDRDTIGWRPFYSHSLCADIWLVHLDYNLQRVKETLITIFSLQTGLADVSITFLTFWLVELAVDKRRYYSRSEIVKSVFVISQISQVSFCHQSSPVSRKAWMLLDYCRSWKKHARKTWDCWRPFESSCKRKGALVAVGICVLWGQGFSNQLEIVSEAPFTCDTAGREL